MSIKTLLTPIFLLFISFTTVISYRSHYEKGHPKVVLTVDELLNYKSSSSSESEEKLYHSISESGGKGNPIYYDKVRPKVLLTTLADLLNYKRSSSLESQGKYSISESGAKTNSLYLRRFMVSKTCEKNGPIYCKKACKRAIELTCSHYPEQCTNNLRDTLDEDCRAQCRLEFDSTYNYNRYVRPKPKHTRKNSLYLRRAIVNPCGKNAHLNCKKALKRAIDLTCGDYPEQCTKDFKDTLVEDCRAECRFEFDSTYKPNNYVRPKSKHTSKSKTTPKPKTESKEDNKKDKDKDKDKNKDKDEEKDKDKDGVKDEGKDKENNNENGDGNDNNPPAE